MNDEIVSPKTRRRFSSPVPFSIIVTISVVSMIASFALGGTFANSEWGFVALIGSVSLYAAICAVTYYYFLGRSVAEMVEVDEPTLVPNSDELDSLDEAAELFAGSLGVSDAFRLVSSHIKRMMPAHSTALLTPDDQRERLKIVQSMGEHQVELLGQFVGLGDSIAGRSFYTSIIEIGREVIDFGFPSAPVACIPLIERGSPVAVFQIYLRRGTRLTDADYETLESVRIRITPLLTAAFGLEKTRTNTLTDTTTGLPNLAAIRGLFAKHVAETSRRAAIRPLSIVSIGVDGFDALTAEYGHAIGDRIVEFVSATMLEGMRSMDLLGRTWADEFMVIAPTADKEACQDVIARIHATFFGRRVKVAENESIELTLNIGYATYGDDGESPDGLIKVARERREQARIGAVPKVLWFPADRVDA